MKIERMIIGQILTFIIMYLVASFVTWSINPLGMMYYSIKDGTTFRIMLLIILIVSFMFNTGVFGWWFLRDD